MSWADDMWWKVPLSVCPICKKKFARAPEHYWMIGEHGFESRDIPVCSYTCMRKWEKEQMARELLNRRNKRRKPYPEWALVAVLGKLNNEDDQKLIRLYFGRGDRAETIAAHLHMDYKDVNERIVEIKAMLKEIMEEAENG